MQVKTDPTKVIVLPSPSDAPSAPPAPAVPIAWGPVDASSTKVTELSKDGEAEAAPGAADKAPGAQQVRAALARSIASLSEQRCISIHMYT